MKKITSFTLALLLVFFCFASCTRKEEDAPVGENGDKVTSFSVIYDDDNDTVETKQPEKQESEPEKDKANRVSFACVGDNIMYHCNFTDAENRANEQYPEYNFTPIYTDILPMIQKADLAFINQEVLMAGEEYGYTSYPCFNSPQHLGDQLVEMGFDVVNIATNHMLDRSNGQGLIDTIRFWNSKEDVTMIGGYLDEEDYNKVRVVEKNGMSIAFLSYTYDTNGIVLNSSYDVVVPYIDSDLIKQDIERAKAAADAVVVSMHWGVENSFEPNDEQKELAQMMCDAGVDVIIGHHPHVLQPVEWFESDNGNKMLCIYSLGNLVAVMMKDANMLGAVATFELVMDKDEVKVEMPLMTPVVHHFGPSYYNSRLYFLEDFTDELASTFGKVYGISSNYDTLAGYCRDIIDDEFLPEYLTAEIE